MPKMPKNRFKALNLLKSAGGFTLIEAMLSVALLGLVAVGISAPYISGFQALDVQADRMLLDSSLRSRMEVLVGTDFGSLSAGSEVVTVRGQNYTITWTVGNVDLDGDATPESTARQVTVSVTELPDRSLATILVDNQGRVGKIS
jgi:type II secretory pathway pseudopilin PulG